MLSDESDSFKREIRIDASSTFAELNDFIISDVGYDKGELTTFHLCDDRWNKEQEIMFMDMGSDDVSSHLMNETKLEELVKDKGQKLLFVFDMLSERAFFLELAGIIKDGEQSEPICTVREGEAPDQYSDINTASGRYVGDDDYFDIDEDMYGSDDYDMDELDSEGFSEFDEYGYDDRY